MKKKEFFVEIRYLHFENYINFKKNPVSRVTSGEKSLSGTKVKEFLPKRKNFRSKNHKKFQKRTKKATNKRQKSDKLSLFKILAVAFCRPQKMRQKSDKIRQIVAFSFVAAHPSKSIQIKIGASLRNLRG
jgi:hypothetical protein